MESFYIHFPSALLDLKILKFGSKENCVITPWISDKEISMRLWANLCLGYVEAQLIQTETYWLFAYLFNTFASPDFQKNKLWFYKL